MVRVALMGVVLVLSACRTAVPLDLQPYPAPDHGFVRKVIRLAPLPDEQDRMIELIVGREAKVDDCNASWFEGAFVEKTAGARRYLLLPEAIQLGTLKGCIPRSEHVAFVRLRKQPLVRYTSREPLVIYVPKGFEVSYRGHQASPTQVAPPHELPEAEHERPLLILPPPGDPPPCDEQSHAVSDVIPVPSE